MRRLLLTVLVLPAIAAAASGAALDPVFSKSNRRSGAALIVGVEPPGGDRPLRAATDAKLVARFAERTLGFSAQRIRTLEGTFTAAALTSALEELNQQSTAPDQPVFVYVAGKAECDEQSIQLVTADGRFLLSRIVETLAKLESEEKSLVLDVACDGLPPPALPAANAGKIVVVGALGGGGRRELTRDGDHGLFTATWLAGLRGSADFDADGLITWAESAGYVRRALKLAAAPEPLIALAGLGAETLVVEAVLPDGNAGPPLPGDEVPSEISVEYEGGKGQLLLDGTSVGETPLILRGLKPGEYQLEVRTQTHTSRVKLHVAQREWRTVRLPIGEAVALPPPPRAVAEVSQAPARGVSLAESKTAIVWSVLLPQFGVERRMAKNLWLGARGHLLLGTGAAAGELTHGALAGVALLARFTVPTESPHVTYEFVGGPSVDAIESQCCSGGVMWGTTVGATVRIEWFTVGLELQTGLLNGQLLALLTPVLAFRHEL